MLFNSKVTWDESLRTNLVGGYISLAFAIQEELQTCCRLKRVFMCDLVPASRHEMCRGEAMRGNVISRVPE